MPLIRPFLFLLALIWMSVVPLASANWPEFRGPDQNGHFNADADLPTTWSEDENVTWKTEIHGKGWSTPVIWGDQIWLTTATPDGTRQYGICLDKASGEVLYDEELFFNKEPRDLGNKRNTYASPSPVIEDGRVYLHFGSYGTACIDTTNFETIWTRRDLPCHHWRGPASSPVLFEDLLILTFDGADYQYTAALNKETGETVWKQDRSTDFNDIGPDGKPERDGDWRKAYNTPVLLELDGKTRLISPGAKAAWAYDPATGDEIWSLHWEEHSTASRTVFSKELNHMYLNTGYGKARILAVKMDPMAKGELSEDHLSWTAMQRTPNRCSPVLIGDRLYVVSDGGVATCLNAKTGEDVWSARVGETYSASLFYGGGHLYFFDEMGNAFVVKPGDEYELVAENQLEEGMFASPAADGDALFLRTISHVYRVEK